MKWYKDPVITFFAGVMFATIVFVLRFWQQGFYG